jgi:hypothetical protein
MRVVTNDRLISRKAGIVRNAMTVGLVLMAVAAVAAFQPRYIAYAYASLLISFPLVNWGGRGAAKWLRSPRPDQVIAKALKSLDHSFQLFCYVLPAACHSCWPCCTTNAWAIQPVRRAEKRKSSTPSSPPICPRSLSP